MATFTYHYDAGHGWLEVHIYDAYDVGLDVDSFTSYSYQAGQMLFLEEDQDAGTFIKAYENHGRTFKTREHNHGSYSDIRNYNRIVPSKSSIDILA